MKLAQPFISTKPWMYRNTYSLDMLAEEMGIGQYFDFYMTDSQTSVFPSGFTTIFGTTWYGRETKVFEVGRRL